MAFGCTLFVSATVGSAKTDFVTTTAPIEVGTVVIPKKYAVVVHRYESGS